MGGYVANFENQGTKKQFQDPSCAENAPKVRQKFKNYLW